MYYTNENSLQMYFSFSKLLSIEIQTDEYC